MKDMICMAVLALMAAEDSKRKTVSGSLLVFLAAAGIADRLMAGRPAAEMVSALLPGILLLAVSVISGGKIGEGDALCFMALGFGLAPETLMGIMCMSFLAAGLFSLCLLLHGGRRAADAEFAFIPFILAAFAADRLLRAL